MSGESFDLNKILEDISKIDNINTLKEFEAKLSRECCLCLKNKGYIDVDTDDWKSKLLHLSIDVEIRWSSLLRKREPKLICRSCAKSVNEFWEKRSLFHTNQYNVLKKLRTVHTQHEKFKQMDAMGHNRYTNEDIPGVSSEAQSDPDHSQLLKSEPLVFPSTYNDLVNDWSDVEEDKDIATDRSCHNDIGEVQAETSDKIQLVKRTKMLNLFSADEMETIKPSTSKWFNAKQQTTFVELVHTVQPTDSLTNVDLERETDEFIPMVQKETESSTLRRYGKEKKKSRPQKTPISDNQAFQKTDSLTNVDLERERETDEFIPMVRKKAESSTLRRYGKEKKKSRPQKTPISDNQASEAASTRKFPRKQSFDSIKNFK